MAAALWSQRKDFPWVQDVLRVQRALDGAHHVHRACAGFVQQKAHLVHAHTMLAGAGAAHAIPAVAGVSAHLTEQLQHIAPANQLRPLNSDQMDVCSAYDVAVIGKGLLERPCQREGHEAFFPAHRIKQVVQSLSGSRRTATDFGMLNVRGEASTVTPRCTLPQPRV